MANSLSNRIYTWNVSRLYSEVFMSKQEIFKLLERVSPKPLSVREIVENIDANKQSVTRTLSRLSKVEKELYGIQSKKSKRDLVVQGRCYSHYENLYWVE